ncbi:MAG: arsenic efflux protein [Clostridia bacterium]|nr:arsenic efflux protein [Clostridia bacterium]
MTEIFLDAFFDTLKLFPFLLVIYILLELFERYVLIQPKILKGKLAPLLGAATGLVPQCGFSVMAAKLYDKKFIRTGTILAVFLATSDEAFAILLSSGRFLSLFLLVLSKLVIAVVAGYAADAILWKREERELQTEERGHFCGKEHSERLWYDYFVMPLLHSLKIALYIFFVTALFGLLFFFVGEDKVTAFLSSNLWLQPIFTTLIGFIPNCASSVVLTQAYLVGGITFGSCVAGLCVNAGMGLVVLLRNVKEWKRNLCLISTLCAISIAAGLVINLVEVLVRG